MEMPQIVKLLKDLRTGKTVVCHKCGKGNIIPVGDYKTTRIFHCNQCDYSITLD